MCYNTEGPKVLSLQFFPSGDDGPVLRYLEALRAGSQKTGAWAKLMRDLGHLESEGLRSRQISVERVVGVPGSVWELRRSFEGVKYRIYFFAGKGEAWLFHYLEKKSPKIPKKDLALIRQRTKEVRK